jgi:hypothetical protein
VKQVYVIALLGLCSATASLEDEQPGRMAEAIQDNSFLVEEAYNQEPGVVQHILAVQYGLDRKPGVDDEAWNLTFTQEWPVFSQRHQFSYTVPYESFHEAGARENGFGDILLNYRFQALFEGANLPAFAPRVSLVLPTGNEDKGLGTGTVGYQLNLPFSKVLHDRWTVHANAGLTVYPDWHSHTPVSYNLGGSAIYAVSRDFNLMLEAVGYWNSEVDETLRVNDEFQAILSPGVRYAFNWPDYQLVLGLAVPVGLNRDSPDVGVFLYVSFEHVWQKLKEL